MGIQSATENNAAQRENIEHCMKLFPFIPKFPRQILVLVLPQLVK